MLESFSSNVIQVIDHHQETANSVANKSDVSTTMEMVGSCASLIAREVLEDDTYMVDEPTATLLLSAILLDTGDLKAAKRVTNTDEYAVQELSRFLPSSFSRDDHFSNMFKARFDVSTLSVKQALQKDYKECTVSNYTIGFSSITALLSNFLLQPSVNSDFMEMYCSHKLDLLIILGILISDPSATKIQKQIAVFQPEGINPEFSESIVNVLEANLELKCERRSGGVVGFQGVLLEQGNVDMSRKHIIPIVTSFVTSV